MKLILVCLVAVLPVVLMNPIHETCDEHHCEEGYHCYDFGEGAHCIEQHDEHDGGEEEHVEEEGEHHEGGEEEEHHEGEEEEHHEGEEEEHHEGEEEHHEGEEGEHHEGEEEEHHEGEEEEHEGEEEEHHEGEEEEHHEGEEEEHHEGEEEAHEGEEVEGGEGTTFFAVPLPEDMNGDFAEEEIDSGIFGTTASAPVAPMRRKRNIANPCEHKHPKPCPKKMVCRLIERSDKEGVEKQCMRKKSSKKLGPHNACGHNKPAVIMRKLRGKYGVKTCDAQNHCPPGTHCNAGHCCHD